MKPNRIIPLFLVLAACSSNPLPVTDPAEPAFSPQRFSAAPTTVDNRYLPLMPGTTSVFQLDEETTVVEVLATTRIVAGVECVVVRDRVYDGELLIEDTHDWFAQDDAGHVWYLGEEVVNYEYDEDGNVVATNNDGAWEAGVDGALPGIAMKADPTPGDSYQQEFYAGVAEDRGTVVALGVPVTLHGTTHLCVQIRDTTPLDPTANEFKYYAPGLGKIREENADGTDQADLLGRFDGSLADFSAASFSDPAPITHHLLPYAPGATWEYEKETDEGTERIVVEALATTRVVAGIECRVVRDRVFLDGVLIEDTHDWYAQDDLGNVWYMGEDVVNYEYDEDGNLLGTNSDGAWEAGVDGALPGIVMWASPVVGQSYRQEFYEDEAEDMAMVAATGVTVTLSDGTTYTNCLKTLEWSPLDPAVLEYKIYAPGVGVVLEEPAGGGEKAELVSGP